MQDNSANRRKTLIISVLLFLFAGGGIFLFFVVQGSNDLTRQGKNQNFTYGEAAREGVSSFFKSVGIVPDEEPKLSADAVARLEGRGLPLDELGVASSNPDMSDWMAKPEQRGASAPASGSASPSVVPKMEGRSGGSVGGLGGGGSKSAGSVSRFGEGSGEGATSVSGKSVGAGGAAPGKGTLATLKNARAILGEGLRSDSAMTASSKWNQSFGVGSGSNRGGGDLAYNKSGLVSLDKIKSGEISNLKMDKKGGLKTPEVGDPTKDNEGTKKALQSDPSVKAAAEQKKKDDEKKEMAKAIADAGGQAADKALNSKGGGAPQSQEKMPEEVQSAMNNASISGKPLANGATATDSFQGAVKNKDGTWTGIYEGTQTNKDGTSFKYRDEIIFDAKGNIMAIKESNP